METITIQAEQRTPEINFDFGANSFLIKGESYPENITDFYGPLLEGIEKHLEDQDGATVQFTFELIYINSSTAKVMMELFDLLDQAAGNGNAVSIIWRIEADDDNMEELGEEFAEDLENASFKIEKLHEA